MFKELFSLPRRLFRPTTKAIAEVIDTTDPLETGLAGDIEETVSPVTETVDDVVDETLEFFGF